MRRRQQIGFTLVELMIVVAIIGVLAVIAGTAYRKYMDSGRSAEVYAMLGEIRAKEEAYKAEYSKYLATSTSETDFYPVLLGAGQEPKAKTWKASAPTTWTNTSGLPTLGLNPTRTQLYCGYAVLADDTGQSPPAAARGNAAFNNTAPLVPYWYAIATCDNDSDGNSAHNAYFVTTSLTTQTYVENEHW
jgi:prepilin-type N-terminal cleavage/methylation domain-containing protein